jgi:2-amino-4-hydroxy-6-hydroxymethyldihydropteridine diphosphokinase
VKVAIGLGASMGDRRRALELALCRLDATPGTRVLRVGRWVRTPPMRGGTARGWFLNGVALLETELDVFALLDRCRALEADAGRRRAKWWGDRPLDLDLLVAEDVVSRDPRLTLPHPGVIHRPFVWGPLAEVWPEAVAGLGPPELEGPAPSPIGCAPRSPRARVGGLPRDACVAGRAG